MKKGPKMRRISLRLEEELAERLDEILAGRNITVGEAVSLYLRAMVNNVDQGKALGLNSRMPFGKYRGELVDVIARADPSYLRYLLGSERPLQLEAEVLELLN